MTWSAAESSGEDVASALIIAKGSADPTALGTSRNPRDGFAASRRGFITMHSGHPIPDERSLLAGSRVQDFVSCLEPSDLLLCLISGGGSALVAAPPLGISLSDLQQFTDSLLSSGATIQEVNIVRRHLDQLKGGGLARATRASIVSLILSDVIGDHLDLVASGPTVSTSTPDLYATDILKQYRIKPPASIVKALGKPTPAKAPAGSARVENVLIGNNRLAVEAAKKQAELEGFRAEILAYELEGEAHNVGRQMAMTLRSACANTPRPFCLVAGGETTVSLLNHGTGGRNQELALAAVDHVADLRDTMLLTLATDGNDGPTDAAGAVVTSETRARAAELGNVPGDFLRRHDAYHFFDALGDLLKPGYTGTNVNDLTFLIGL
jgi:hydroxypyruvate reductase